MSRKNKNKHNGDGNNGDKSLRNSIKSHRQCLHGEVAQAFDEAFCSMAGEFPLKKALSDGKNLQKAFVAAKQAAFEMQKRHPIVQVPNLPEDD